MADALQVITLKVTQLSSEIQDANTRSITANSKVSEQAAVIAQLERTVSRMSMQFLVFFKKKYFKSVCGAVRCLRKCFAITCSTHASRCKLG